MYRHEWFVCLLGSWMGPNGGPTKFSSCSPNFTFTLGNYNKGTTYLCGFGGSLKFFSPTNSHHLLPQNFTLLYFG
jgi:hypothetical protein